MNSPRDDYRSQNQGNAMAVIYRVQVKGCIADRWSEWFDGLVIERREDGTTILTGPLADQSALHGVITRIRDLGLPLLSLSRIDGTGYNL